MARRFNEAFTINHIPTMNYQNASAVLSQFSEWLLYSAALGNGVRHDLPETQGLVFTSSIIPAAHETFREAERQFRIWHDHQVEPLRQQLAELEAEEARRRKPDRPQASGSEVTPQASGSEVTLPWESADDTTAKRPADLKVLREQLSHIPAVTWREQDVHKSTLIELLKRSAYGAMTFVDEFGARAPALLHGRNSNDAGWVSLTGRSSADAALIRASATGGASIHSLAGACRASFSYISCPPDAVVRGLIKTISKPESTCPAKGFTLCLAGDTRSAFDAKPLLDKHELLQLMKSVYARPDEASRVAVGYESDEVRNLWQDFANADETYFTGRETSQAAANVFSNTPASVRVLVSFAAKAVVAECVAEASKQPGFQTSREAKLTAAHLDKARMYVAAVLFRGTKFLDVRRSNAEKARAALKAPERIEKALEVMQSLCEASADCKVPFTKAIRTPGVTAGLLDALVEQGRLIELKGKEGVGMKNKTKRAYTLPGGCADDDLFRNVEAGEAAAGKDPEEAAAEYEQARLSYEADGGSHSGGQLVAIYRELQTKAERNSVDYGLPAVAVHQMTSQQIAALPELVEYFKREVRLRGTAAAPEPEALFEFENDDEDMLVRGVPNLWFRYRRDGKPMRDWTIVPKLELTEWAGPT